MEFNHNIEFKADAIFLGDMEVDKVFIGDELLYEYVEKTYEEDMFVFETDSTIPSDIYFRVWDSKDGNLFSKMSFQPDTLYELKTNGLTGIQNTGDGFIKNVLWFPKSPDLNSLGYGYMGGIYKFNAPLMNTAKVSDFYNFLSGSQAIELVIGELDFSSANDLNMIFNGAMFEKINGNISNLKKSLNLDSTRNIGRDTAVKFINAAIDTDNTQTLTFNSNVYNRLTEEDIASATAKGWTVISA